MTSLKSMQVLLLIVVAFVFGILASKYSKQLGLDKLGLGRLEGFEDDVMGNLVDSAAAEPVNNESSEPVQQVAPVENGGIPSNVAGGLSNCLPMNQLTSQDLLPTNAANSSYASVSPKGQGDVDGRSNLPSIFSLGVNTSCGQSKVGNHNDLRGYPPNPQVAVSAWNNSTVPPYTLTNENPIGSQTMMMPQ